MKKFLLCIGLVAALAACTEDKDLVYDYPARPDVEPMPSVAISPVAAEHNALEFTITPTNAEVRLFMSFIEAINQLTSLQSLLKLSLEFLNSLNQRFLIIRSKLLCFSYRLWNFSIFGINKIK